jgi:glycosyltransferase involved in cell wall biosynthesis
LVEGTPSHKLLSTSYGWSESRIKNANIEEQKTSSKGELDLLFVGLACLRKGIHILLRAFEESGVHAKLTVVGAIDSMALPLIEPFLGNPRINFVPFTEDVSRYYHNADIFVFPSLEEGSPQVIYEALACGLPCLVSPMGSGGVARNGHEAIIIDSLDTAMWSESIRLLCSKSELRKQMSESARERAKAYEYSFVSKSRIKLMLSKL